jgi:hypothetical protein
MSGSIYDLRQVNHEINKRYGIQPDADLQKKKAEIMQAIALHTFRLYRNMTDEALLENAQAKEKRLP